MATISNHNNFPILRLKGINKSFSGVQVLHDISFDLHKGEVHCIVGENGAGKSTLIKIISGAYKYDSGDIIYQGETLHHLTPRLSIDKGICTIYQEIDIIPVLTAAENISLGNEPIKQGGNIDKNAIQNRASRALENIGAEIDINKPVGALSVAHQQMVAIAKALSMHSKVLIFDEPTAVFAATEIETLFKVIQRLKAQGIAIIYISHHLDEIFRIGDRVTVFRDGWVTGSGPVSDFDTNTLVRAMVGREIDFSHQKKTGKPGAELLRVSGLSRKGAFEGVTFSLKQGEIVGVAGLVGSGRTKVARAIIGADSFDKGELHIRGEKKRIKSPRHALANGLGMLPKNRKEEGLVLVRPLIENAAYSLVEKLSRMGLVPWRKIKHIVSDNISNLDIRYPSLNSEARYLSGGNQQKVVLAKWLAAACDVIILDEPTRGVDVGARSEIYKLMHKLINEGKAILMISSDLPEILTQSDRVLVMAKGKIVGEVLHEEATEERILSMALQV